ncbi:hypothetical protein BEH94_09600 [Candidatus Altiarchaeales archaeon WOR_SM1_SCG]|nr:hypothetical protein BEH94_09600 [Candidatus Altiarchaeales archaeon WOR_SM1_SCG]
MTEELLGIDLKLSGTRVDKFLEFRDLQVNAKGDFDVVSGNYNLGQAIFNRISTRQGELEEFGHPAYGSRLYELIGEPNNERTRELIKMYVRECLMQEPRIKDIPGISVKERTRDSVDVSITVIPIESEVALNIVFPFYLEIV